VQEAIVWLGRRSPGRLSARIGPKAASLCKLRGLGAKVPPGFFVTTAAFREHLCSGDLCAQMAACLDVKADHLETTLEQIRKLITDSSLPDPVREHITTAYQRLDAGTVAVRSSATAEDLPGHSFAGQYETILGVTSLEACLGAVKKCWASLWTERAYEYRRRNGIDHGQVEMAVIVQEQIEPEAAGVVFTLDPVTGSPSRIVIEACAGLGERLVSGHVTPERIVLRKKNLGVIRQTTANGEPVLEVASAQRLARQARRIERKLRGPQDIEWAMRDGDIWFLQARPITAIPEPKPWEERQVWTNLNLGEVVPDVMSPMTRSMIEPMFTPLFGSILRLVGADVTKAPIVGFVAGRLYFNINTGLAAGMPFNQGPERWARASTLMGGQQNRLFELGEIDLCEEDLPDLGFSWFRYILSWPRIVRTIIAHRPSRGEAFKASLRAQGDTLSRVDAKAVPTEELLSLIGEMIDGSLANTDLLFLGPGTVGLSVLEKVCRDWLGDEDLTLVFRLFAAQGGITDTQAGLDLWRLASLAHESNEIESLMLSEITWGKVRPALERTEHGRRFLVAWDRFMSEHGHHCRGELELLNARWSERPDYILNLLRGYLRSADSADPLANQQRLAEQRERLTLECRRRLKNPIKRWIFDWALRNGRKVAVDRENWKNEAVRHIASFRRVVLELGERLVRRGILRERDDIFFLEIPEVEPVASGAADFDVAERIAQRRAEYERNCRLTPPPVVVGRFDPHKHRMPEVDTMATLLKGTAVSPGMATGKAKVILHTDDYQHVEAGEVLVAPSTDPAWTPYFLPAAAVVMDLGGILSHGAIIAREYGIPAVANVAGASRIIRTGQTIEVDGDRGLVRILSQVTGSWAGRGRAGIPSSG